MRCTIDEKDVNDSNETRDEDEQWNNQSFECMKDDEEYSHNWYLIVQKKYYKPLLQYELSKIR